jgi:hypothetical protein
MSADLTGVIGEGFRTDAEDDFFAVVSFDFGVAVFVGKG